MNPDTDTKIEIKSPSQPSKSSVKGKFPALLTLLALLLPCLGLLVLHVFAKSSSMFLPLVLANLLLVSGLVLCWAVIRKRGARGSLPVILAAVVGICLFIFWPKHAPNTIKYSYTNNASQLSTVQAGGMSFSKPSQFSSTAKKSEQNFSTESFAHLSSSGYPLGYIFTFSYKDSHTNDKQYIGGVNDFMNGSVKNNYRSQYIDTIKKQVFDSYPGYTAKLGEPQKFTNANINKNAWSFDLDVTSYNPDVKPMKGKLIYALGDGSIYYFALMITEDNWAPNMATWQSVLGSLKL